MIALVLERAGLDPTAVIGGRLSAFGSNARLGRGEYMVAEADESDRSFLKLFPSIAVITNIDREHMEAYGSFDDLQQAFVDFANKVPFYGAVVACADDPELLRDAAALHAAGDHLRHLTRDRRRTSRADGRARSKGSAARCTVVRRTPRGGGRRNARHAAAAGARPALGAERAGGGRRRPRARRAVRAHRGGARRVSAAPSAASSTAASSTASRVVDDYGHHPTEIAAVLAAARAAQSGARRRRVSAAPLHAHARPDARVRPGARGADEVVLTDIYAASEDPIPGITVEALAAAVNTSRATPVHVVPRLDDVAARARRPRAPGRSRASRSAPDRSAALAPRWSWPSSSGGTDARRVH